MGGCRELWTRKLGSEFSAVALTLYASIGMVLVGICLGVGEWTFDDTQALMAVLAAGLCHGVAMLLITTALQWGEASFVAPFRLTSLLWAALVAWIVFGESFSPSQMFGAGLIICVPCSYSHFRQVDLGTNLNTGCASRLKSLQKTAALLSVLRAVFLSQNGVNLISKRLLKFLFKRLGTIWAVHTYHRW